MASDPNAAITPAPCIHCGVPVEQRVGGVPICDACYPVRGACCQEFSENEEPDRGGSAPCYANLFDDYADPKSPPPSQD